MWEFCDQNPRFNNVFNEAMANDSQMMCLVVKDCKQVFQEMDSMADVGGGTGLIAKTILAAFPHLKCTVLDLPHVVANMPDTENLKYVGGDMFQSIPSADTILFKGSSVNQADSATDDLFGVGVLFSTIWETMETNMVPMVTIPYHTMGNHHPNRYSMLYQGTCLCNPSLNLLVEIACTRYPFSFAYVYVLRKAKIVKAKLGALD
ncbi:putative histone H3.2-like [Capsicum annuum]|nr:putative histone H3.2-like [Capsicum annuum]KAF3680482.1 putative histone H3.2-like [Capsicum annuum]